MVMKVCGAVPLGVEAVMVEVEVDINNRGLPGFTIVGLPGKAVDEARERVRAAIKNAGYEFVNKKITVNLAPADLPKEGTVLDLAIAVGILAVSGQIAENLVQDCVFYGELGLSGDVRRSFGAILAAGLCAKKHKVLALPADNENEARLVEGLEYVAVGSLKDFKNNFVKAKGDGHVELSHGANNEICIEDIKGQVLAKRGMMVAVAGGHNILLSGSPGMGKTMLARAAASILPPMTNQEYMEVVSVYSAANMIDELGGNVRPFRSPHHSLSQVSLVGGGTRPRPGEISLAHMGVLFLDELPLFGKNALESLRQPMEDKRVLIARANFRVVLPCDFMLIAAVNPCPCGYMNHPTRACSCTPVAIERYRQKISGPVMDRIDLVVRMSDVEPNSDRNNMTTSEILKLVSKARERQYSRNGGKTNASMAGKAVLAHCILSPSAKNMLDKKMTSGDWSYRAMYRVLRVARTIADLEGNEQIDLPHLSEASMYRLPEW